MAEVRPVRLTVKADKEAVDRLEAATERFINAQKELHEALLECRAAAVAMEDAFTVSKAE